MLDVCTALSALEIIPIKDEFTQFLGKKIYFYWATKAAPGILIHCRVS